ncbi:c-type cytochrome [Indioceanicola profundi]|uniref:c-type cytochrome n=1 Tax=Indioceanicola profundi TaxID=2220096 RepID=UPI000E6AA01E|nr:cytochrome c [Indioceanicola profundi]
MDHEEKGRSPKRGKPAIIGVLTGALGVLALMGLAGLFVVYTGAFNVAATEEHASVTRWAFDTTFHNSVQQRAEGIEIPEGFSPTANGTGASEYKAMCQHCHAGPGVERAEWAMGMRPLPPHLTEAAAEWKPEEVFWLAKHGVKMSGMPAFGPTHDDQTLWAIAAFVKALPAMTPEEYAALGDGSHGSQGSRGGHGHDGGHGN